MLQGLQEAKPQRDDVDQRRHQRAQGMLEANSLGRTDVQTGFDRAALSTAELEKNSKRVFW